jgi:hypothetical protein
LSPYVRAVFDNRIKNLYTLGKVSAHVYYTICFV